MVSCGRAIDQLTGLWIPHRMERHLRAVQQLARRLGRDRLVDHQITDGLNLLRHRHGRRRRPTRLPFRGVPVPLAAARPLVHRRVCWISSYAVEGQPYRLGEQAYEPSTPSSSRRV